VSDTISIVMTRLVAAAVVVMLRVEVARAVVSRNARVVMRGNRSIDVEFCVKGKAQQRMREKKAAQGCTMKCTESATTTRLL
jgi:hypothetical protein